jgi:hypothetical protein
MRQVREHAPRGNINQCNLVSMTHPPVLGRVLTMARDMPSFQGRRFRLVNQQDDRNQRQKAETDQHIENIADGTVQGQPRRRPENPVQRVNKLIHDVPLPWKSS